MEHVRLFGEVQEQNTLIYECFIVMNAGSAKAFIIAKLVSEVSSFHTSEGGNSSKRGDYFRKAEIG